MSSEKIYTTVGLDKEIYERLVKEAQDDQRSRGFIVTQALRDFFNRRRGELEVKQNVQ